MFELITIVIFLWLLAKTTRLAFKLTWGVAKITASILIGMALPVMFISVVFIGGIALLIPIAMIAIAASVVKVCD